MSVHKRAIDALREEADRREARGLAPWGQGERSHVTRLRAAADLLEVHDMTGINLTTFGYVEHFVNDMLASIGYPNVKDNGV